MFFFLIFRALDIFDVDVSYVGKVTRSTVNITGLNKI